MQQFLPLIGLFLIVSGIQAQTYTPYQLCTPGVDGQSVGRGLEITYSALPPQKFYVPNNSALGSEGQWRSNDQLQFKLKVPLVLKSNFKMIMGLTHVSEEFHVFSPEMSAVGAEEFGGQRFRQNRINILALKPLDHKHYLVFRSDFNFNGNYQSTVSFDRKYLSYRIAGVYGIKKNQDLEYGIGLAYNHGLDRSAIFPFLIYNQTFNNKWGIESVLPARIKGRYNIDKSSMLLFGVSYQGANYRMNGISNTVVDESFLYERRTICLEIDYERQVQGWTWVSVTAGYSVPFNSRVTSDLTGEIIPTVIQSGPYMRFSFFLSPTSR